MARRGRKTGGMTIQFKILLFLILAGLVIGGVQIARNNGLLDSVSNSIESSKGAGGGGGGKPGKVITVGSVDWLGHSGCPYFNGGFKASKASRYFKEYGILVDFKINNDFAAQRNAFKAGKIDVLWITAGAFATEAGTMADLKPKIFMQADWSRGGDAFVVMPGINSMDDLRGKKVAVAYGTPSHTFLLKMLKANGMTQNDVNAIKVPSAIDAAAAFKARRVQGAVVWSPDDEDCITSVSGAKVLKSTKDATHIIADVMYAREEYIDANEDKLVKLVEGWMRGNAEINTSQQAKEQCAQIMSKGMGQDIDFCRKGLTNVRLTTIEDNKNFFGVNTAFKGVKGEDLYSEMTTMFQQVGFIRGSVPSWRQVSDTRVLRAINLSGAEHNAEGAFKFEKATAAEATASAFSTKRVTINFPSGSATLSSTAKFIVDDQLANILLAFGGARIRLEGNTDKTGSLQTNMRLSRARAQAVADHLVATYGFDVNRFIVKGNGPNNPVCTQATPACFAKNRRTEAQILN